MFLSAFSTGFLIGFSLILAIGSQNAFVLRQGLTGHFILPVVLFCAISDAILICAGVFGFSHIISSVFTAYRDVVFMCAGVWLAGYGVLRARSVFSASSQLDISSRADLSQSLSHVLGAVALMTWLNPHVYLDTVVLMGTVSLGFEGTGKYAFALGASMASFLFFTALGYGAKLFSPLMGQARSWQIVDGATSLIMLGFAAIMFSQLSIFTSEAKVSLYPH